MELSWRKYLAGAGLLDGEGLSRPVLVILEEREDISDPPEGFYFAAKTPAAVPEAAVGSEGEGWLFWDGPDFIDRVKALTGEEGFATVIVLSGEPEAVTRALGVARVLGTVYLSVAPKGPVTVDLHNTVHYKGLRVRAGRIPG